MRIVCDGCGAKYQVDDSKVENRSFKFPCKKCGEKIVVRQNGVQAESATPEAPPAADEAFEPTTQLAYDDHLARQAEEEGAVWYVAVGKERVGPISASDVEAYIAQGEVTGTSFVWCDGMDDWTALEAVPALSRLLPQSHDAGLGAPTGENGVPADGGQTGGEDLFVSEQREATFDEPANSPVISTAQLTGQRHENSVLFSLDSLDNDSKPASGMMTPSATGNTEASGLIDLAMLAGDSQNLDNVFNQAGPSGAPMGAPIKPMASLVTQPKKSRIGLIIAAVAILVAGLTGAVVWFLLKPQQTSIKAATTVATTTPKPAAPAPQAKPVEKNSTLRMKTLDF
ncbi:MAG: GYF domain-containing protein, partial [Bradymonadia bacterium]